MVKFDSEEYWIITTWDRFRELDRVPFIVKEEFLHQEKLLLYAMTRIITDNDRTTVNILDLGCGTGRLAWLLLEGFKDRIHLTLLDLNPHTLEIAKNNLSMFSNVKFIQGNFYYVNELVEQKMDVIICMEIFHHVCHLDKLLGSIASTLKSNGVLIGNVFSVEKYKEWDLKKYGLMKSLQRRGLSWLATNVYRFCPNKVRTFLRRAGLARIEPILEDEMLRFLNRHFSIIDTDQGYYLWFCAKKLVNHVGKQRTG